MTTLAITPNWKNKSAKFKGTVAAGEHVSVTIQNDDGEGGEFIADASTLRLRVVNPCNGRTLAIFPEPVPEGETPETWDSDLSPLRCTLNLNTVQMLKAVPPAANVPLLFVLDDYDNNTLYFKEQFPVEHWPRLRGEEEPTDLDNYKDIIADFNTRLDGYDTRITGAENAAQAATENASAAATEANRAVGIANQAVDKAETAQNSAAASAEAAHNSALAAEEAQEAAESAAESINSPDATLTEEGVAADAKATGDAIAAEKERAETAEAAEETRAKGVESGLRTDLTAAQEAINDEAVLRAAADADLEANKADKATTYTKSEVDAKIAGFVDDAEYDSGSKKIIFKHGTTTVAEIDATDFIKDGMVSSVEIEGGNLVITFNTDAGQDPISIPLTDIFNPDNYYNKSEADALLAGKQAKLYTQGEPGWTFSTESTGTEIEAFMANAANYSVTEEQSGSAWLYTLTGYDEENYYVAPVGRTAQSTSIPFYVFDVTQTSMYGSVLAEYSSAQTDIPAQVDTTPTANSNRLVTSGGVHEATADAVKYVADKDGNKTAVTVGSRAEGDVGRMSLTVGVGNFARHCALATGDSNVVWDECLGVGQGNTVGSAHDEKSFAAGRDNVVPTACSGAIGRDLQTSNNYEAAVGRGNVSRNGSGAAADTRFSVGIGGSGSSRRNAFEVMQSGTVYVLGVGGYEGTAAGAMGEDLATVISAILNGAVLNALGYEYSAWDMSAFPATFQSSQPQTYHNEVTDKYEWIILTGGVVVSDEKYDTEADALAALSITLRGPQLSDGAVATRTRTATSYRLGTAGGPNADKPLQPALSQTQLDNIAAVPDKADETTPIAALPANLFPVVWTDGTTTWSMDADDAKFTRYAYNDPYQLNSISRGVAVCMFDPSTGKLSEYAAPMVSVKFNGTEGDIGTWPTITRYGNGGTVVRDQWTLKAVTRAPNPTAGNLPALTSSGGIADSGIKPSDKLDVTSAAPAYSASATYSVGDHVTYNGALYVCSTAISTAEAWNSAHWTAEDMTTPDATLDVTATDKLLRLVATNGDIIWGQGYNLSTTSSATVLTEQVGAFTFAADAAADQAIVLPSIAAGKVGDFILDVTNLSANDRSLTLTGLDSAFSVVVKAGDDLSETLTVAAGEMARYYFTMTAFRVNSLPTWQVSKEAVENGGAQS